MTLSTPHLKTLKRLFAMSGNRCNFPKCNISIVDKETGTAIGEICHIKGKKEGSVRYDPNQSDEDRHGFDNLLIICPMHHKVIGDDPDSYTVSRLEKIKKTHEEINFGKEIPSNKITQLFIDQLENLFPKEESNFNQLYRMVINYDNDLRLNYILEAPKGIYHQYGTFLANIPEGPKLKLLFSFF